MFISFEGVEGAGKSTQLHLVGKRLGSKGYTVVLTAEPGGTVIGDDIRKILLNRDNREMSPLTELLLYSASRAQHISEVILPALDNGEIVLSDRFTDSTIAYQGFGRGLNKNTILEIIDISTKGLKPDITILFDLDVKEGLHRNKGAGKTDRLETENVDFHKKVRQGFIELARQEPKRFVVLDARMTIEKTTDRIMEILEDYI